MSEPAFTDEMLIPLVDGLNMPTMLDLKTVLEGEPKRATQRKDSSG